MWRSHYFWGFLHDHFNILPVFWKWKWFALLSGMMYFLLINSFVPVFCKTSLYFSIKILSETKLTCSSIIDLVFPTPQTAQRCQSPFPISTLFSPFNSCTTLRYFCDLAPTCISAGIFSVTFTLSKSFFLLFSPSTVQLAKSYRSRDW